MSEEEFAKWRTEFKAMFSPIHLIPTIAEAYRQKFKEKYGENPDIEKVWKLVHY